MHLWRCVPKKFVGEAFDGKGGLFVDGRWHNKGRLVVYTSEDPGAAVLEALVHVGDLEILLAAYVLIGAEIPDALIADAQDIPDDWNAVPFAEPSQRFGDGWLDSKTGVALRVPCAVVPTSNVLLNPSHPDFSKLVVDSTPVSWDPRLAS